MSASGLFPGRPPGEVVRIAATSDVHCKRDSRGLLRPVFEEIADKADILLVCGDLTHFGLIDEVEVFLHEVGPALRRIPVLSVLGNHDYESGREDELWRILSDAGIYMLDGNKQEIHGIGFTGVKGFGGGFGKRALQPWGESTIKNFVEAAINESTKLDLALSKLNSGPKIVLMHYAPILDTVEGEPPEIFPFLGSSRLEEALNRHSVTAAFHGHAHKGNLQGQTSAGIPVFNVSLAVLQQHFPGRAPYLMFEVPVGGTVLQPARSRSEQDF